MKAVIAVDKFAGTMTSPEAGQAIAEGWLSVRGNDTVTVIPMADGGPGTVDALSKVSGARTVSTTTVNQYDEPVSATWLVLKDNLAVVEAASACGLHLTERRSPLDGDTTGLGHLLRDVVGAGHTEVIVGLGGSGTIDSGVGMAIGLGAKFRTEEGETSGPAPRWMAQMTETSPVEPLGLERIRLATDVDNPLLGPRGAARVFGPQKGATEQDIAYLERCLERTATIAQRDLPGGPWHEARGAGAAGGLGFGAMAWLGAEVVGGADLVADETGLDSHLDEADVVITGEGSADASTLEGKVPIVVARRAGATPTYLVAGRATPEVRGHFNRTVELGPQGLITPQDETRRAGAAIARGI